MKIIAIAFRYLTSRPLAAGLNLLLLTLGLASITFVLLVSTQLDRAFERDLAGIDVVVGAKGSPMQLILSGVLHIDVPPGNVPLQAVRTVGHVARYHHRIGQRLLRPRHHGARVVVRRRKRHRRLQIRIVSEPLCRCRGGCHAQRPR